MKPQKQTILFPFGVNGLPLHEKANVEECMASYKKQTGYFFTSEQLNEYTKGVIKQALETAADKAITKDAPYSYTGNTGSEYPPDIIVDKESIANTAEETFKKFEV